MKKLSVLEREVASGKPVVTMTVGDSMEPLLFHQSTRVVIRKADRELNRNDLAFYKRPTGQFVMHRVIRKSKDCYYTRGDNRTGLEKVPKAWVQGVVTEIYRKERHFGIENKWYRCYVFFWNLLYPVRYGFYQLRRKKKRRKARSRS